MVSALQRRAQARSPGFQPGAGGAAKPLPLQPCARSRAPEGAQTRKSWPRYPGLKPGATCLRPQGAHPAVKTWAVSVLRRKCYHYLIMSLPRLVEEELRLFSERIARSLAQRPQTMDVRAHRERIALLVREMGEATYYELLGIEPTASALEIHDGFERTARLVHPVNAARLGYAGREGALQVLFERATEAYLTLSAIDRRKRYDRELGPRLWKQRVPAATVTASEEAARLYERARALAAAGQVHSAVELLRDSVRLSPKAEALALLGTLEAKNPHWLRDAEQHLEKAIHLGAQARGLPEALQKVQERLARLAAGQPLEADEEDEEVRIV